MKRVLMFLFLSGCTAGLAPPIPAGSSCELSDACAAGYACGCADGDDVCESGLACIPAGSFGTACLPDDSCLGGGCIDGMCTIACADGWCPNTFECVNGVCAK